MSPDSPENKCPRCGSEDPLIVGEACGYHPLHTPHRWHVEAPRVGGSGRINTSAEEARNQGDFLGDDLSGEHSCHAGCPCHSGPEVHITNQSQPEPGGEGPKEPVVGEGELRARIEAKAREYEKDAEYADASGHKAAMAQARLLRSLLVPKEEA